METQIVEPGVTWLSVPSLLMLAWPAVLLLLLLLLLAWPAVLLLLMVLLLPLAWPARSLTR